jgi:hypothetical protein
MWHLLGYAGQVAILPVFVDAPLVYRASGKDGADRTHGFTGLFDLPTFY